MWIDKTLYWAWIGEERYAQPPTKKKILRLSDGLAFAVLDVGAFSCKYKKVSRGGFDEKFFTKSQKLKVKFFDFIFAWAK